MVSCLSATKQLFAWRMSTTGPLIYLNGFQWDDGGTSEDGCKSLLERELPQQWVIHPRTPQVESKFFKQINIQRGYLSSCSSQGRFQTSTKDSMPPVLGYIHIKHVLIIKLCWSGLVMWTWMFFWDWPLATVTEYSSKSANTQTILVWYSDNTLMIQTQVKRFTSPAGESFTSIDDNNRKINS